MGKRGVENVADASIDALRIAANVAQDMCCERQRGGPLLRRRMLLRSRDSTKAFPLSRAMRYA